MNGSFTQALTAPVKFISTLGKIKVSKSTLKMAMPEGYFECGICLEEYNATERLPKRLPYCSHTFCQDCLKKIAPRKSSKKTITCPICKRQQPLLDRRVSDLAPDIDRLNLMDKMKCKDCEQFTYCISSCQHCRINICQQCFAFHRSKDHCDIIEILRAIKSKSTIVNLKDRAKAHREKLLQTQTEYPDLKVRVNDSIDEMIQQLEARRSELLKQLNQAETETQAEISVLDNAIKGEKFLIETRDLLGHDTSPEALTLSKEASLRLKEYLSKIELKAKGELDAEKCFYLNTDRLSRMIRSYGHVPKTEREVVYSAGMDYTGKTRAKITDSVKDKFEQVNDVAVCPVTGTMFVCVLNYVRVYRCDGAYITKFHTGSENQRITTNHRKQIIMTYWKGHNVRIYSQTGEILKQFGSLGTGPGDFLDARGVACDDINRIYVADRGNSRISIHEPDGTFVSHVGHGILSGPLRLVVNKYRDILVTDYNLNKVFVFNQCGELISIFGDIGSLSLTNPTGITLDNNGYILVANNSDIKQIEVYKPDGTHHTSMFDVDNEFGYLMGIAKTAHGQVVIADRGRKQILFL